MPTLISSYGRSSFGQTGSPGRLNGYNTTGRTFTVDRDPFGSSTQHIELPMRKVIAEQDLPQSAKSYSFSTAKVGMSNATLGRNVTGNGNRVDPTSGTAITVPPLETFSEEDDHIDNEIGTRNGAEDREIVTDIDVEKSFTDLQNSTEVVLTMLLIVYCPLFEAIMHHSNSEKL